MDNYDAKRQERIRPRGSGPPPRLKIGWREGASRRKLAGVITPGDVALPDARVVVIDAQASGATPAQGALLELAWAEVTGAGLATQARARWVTPPEGTHVSTHVRRLTGWSEAALASSTPPEEVYRELTREIAPAPRRALIHFASFELRFLTALHARVAPDAPFPLDVICLHALARRLLPDLPRRSLRALAGYLGHSPSQLRRAAGHVEATAAVWAGLLPLLAAKGVHTWDALRALVASPAPRVGRVVPLATETRRALPKGPGVYRLLRSNGDVLYVGKATSLRARVSSHVSGRRRAGETALEMLSQLKDVDVTETATPLEAALLEADEIKRLDPPYNVHLRRGPRRVFFADATLTGARAGADEAHHEGPLPSPRQVEALGAIASLLDGASPSETLRARAVAVPLAFAPDEAIFAEGFAVFAARRLSVRARTTRGLVMRAALAALRDRPGEEDDEKDDADAPPGWTAEGVSSALEDALAQGGRLLFRARLLLALSDATIAFREAGDACARSLELRDGQIVACREIADVGAIARSDTQLSWDARRRSFDIDTYDRVRVLVTELARVVKEGGDVAIAVRTRAVTGERAARLLLRS